MPRGVPLTPDETARAAEVFERTGSYTEAARAIGAADHSTVRKALLRRGDPDRSRLHTRACAVAVRKARKHVAAALDSIARRIADTPDPKDAAALATALVRLSDAALAHDARAGRRLQARLTRDKTRAETAAMARGPGTGVTPDDLDQLERDLAGGAGAARADEPEPAAGPAVTPRG
jgi:hypothetical protein